MNSTEPGSNPLRPLLDAAVGAEPPLSLDPRGVAAAGRRRVIRRRLATGGAGLAVLAVLGSGAATLPSGGAERHPGLDVGAAPRVAASPSPPADSPSLPPATSWPLPTVPEFRSAKDPAQHRIAARLTAALPGALPDRFGTSPRFQVSQGGFKASGDLTDAGGTGSLFIMVNDLRAAPLNDVCLPPTFAPYPDGRSAPTVHCVDGPAGSIVSISAQRAPNRVIYLSVSAYRRDGVQVVVELTNYGTAKLPAMKTPPAPTATRATPPLTEPEAIALVTNPRLRP